MLLHWKKLEVCKTEPPQVLGQPLSQFPVGERAVALLGKLHPRAQMHLIDCNWPVESDALSSLCHPGSIAPGIGQIPNDRSGAWRRFGIHGVGVSFIDPIAIAGGTDMVIV